MSTSLAARLHDGATIAIGGVGLNRKPMALVREIVGSGARDLVIVAFLGSVDVELLIASGVAGSVHTAGTALDAAGLAPRYRTARQDGSVRVVEWSEGSLAAALQAGAQGLGSMPCSTAPGSDIVGANPHLVVAPDPFGGAATTFAEALVPDIGIVQGSAVDDEGNVHVDGDPAVDALVAKASRYVVASVVAEEDRSPRHAGISRLWIDEVVVDPRSSWPTACPPSVSTDLAAVTAWATSGGADAGVLMGAARG